MKFRKIISNALVKWQILLCLHVYIRLCLEDGTNKGKYHNTCTATLAQVDTKVSKLAKFNGLSVTWYKICYNAAKSFEA